MATIYDRMGGDSTVRLIIAAFFDEILENPKLNRFFENISIPAMQVHQLKFFRVIFGPATDQPDDKDVVDYMLKSHSRLFREMGLSEKEFDLVAESLVQSLQSLLVEQSVIDEVVQVLGPLRAVFEYGAKVAVQEKGLTDTKDLPVANATTLGTDTPVVLPPFSNIPIPEWLPMGNVRAWTHDLTDRFEHDPEIADTFMAQHYMDHHVYLVAFLQLAFMPDHVPEDHRKMILSIVQYPLGPEKALLSRNVFKRMTSQFRKTCKEMGFPKFEADPAYAQLGSYLDGMAAHGSKINGVEAPHFMRKVPAEPKRNLKRLLHWRKWKVDSQSPTSSATQLV